MSPAALARLHLAAMTLPRPWTAQEFSGLLASPGCFVLGDDRAFALGRGVLDEVELLTLATHPAHRRQGLARALLGGFHDTARSRGARRALLEVAATNVPALALYAQAGYAEVGRRQAYYLDADAVATDAIVMALPLCAS